jgi:hypothetical protein
MQRGGRVPSLRDPPSLRDRDVSPTRPTIFSNDDDEVMSQHSTTAGSPSGSSNRKGAGGASAMAADNVKVVCRVRPFSRREIDIQAEMNAGAQHEWDKRPIRSIIEMENNVTIFLDPETFVEKERFNFDISLWSVAPDQQKSNTNAFANQEKVMQSVGLPALAHVWNGFNTCLFAYGQTGSGKTYTMMGSEEEPGLIPRICQELFRSLELKRAEDNSSLLVEGVPTAKEYRLEARFLEIYNEKVKDLLWDMRPASESTDGIDRENLKVRNLPNQGPIVVGLTSVVVDKWEDCMNLIAEGTKNRSVAATKMNETSSRSHSIFRLNFIQTTRILPSKPYERPKVFDKVSNVSLVDLAGSERNKKTGAQGERLKEAVAINQSLTVLKNVIDALVEGRQVIPYRNSQLTFLLSESLGGNSKTYMISCASPHIDNADETLNTLRYALRTQGIVCHAQVNEADELKKMQQMKQELEALRELKSQPEVERDELLKEQLERAGQLQVMMSEAETRQRETERLQAEQERSRDFRFNSAYQGAFRLLMCNRVVARAIRNQAEIRRETEEVQASLPDFERAASRKNIERNAAAKVEADARTLRKSRERELEKIKSAVSVAEWRKKSLITSEERQRRVTENLKSLRPWITTIGKLLVAQRWREYQQRRTTFETTVASALTTHVGKLEASAVAREVTRREELDKMGAEISQLVATHAAAKFSLSSKAKEFASKAQDLHAQHILLERSAKDSVEAFERDFSKFSKQKALSMVTLKEDWVAALVRMNQEFDLAFAERKEVSAEVLQITESILRQMHDRRSAKYGHVNQSNSELRSKALLSLVAQCTQDVAQLNVLNEETNNFVYTHSLSEPRFKPAYDMIQQCKASAALLPRDAKALVEALSAETRVLRSVTPSRCTAGRGGEQQKASAVPKTARPTDRRSPEADGVRWSSQIDESVVRNRGDKEGSSSPANKPNLSTTPVKLSGSFRRSDGSGSLGTTSAPAAHGTEVGSPHSGRAPSTGTNKGHLSPTATQPSLSSKPTTPTDPGARKRVSVGSTFFLARSVTPKGGSRR